MDQNSNTYIVFNNDNEKFTVNCNTKEKLKDVILKYRIKSGDTESNHFIRNCQILNLEMASKMVELYNALFLENFKGEIIINILILLILWMNLIYIGI